ncbi:MAG: ATP-binding protein [archaeon]
MALIPEANPEILHDLFNNIPIGVYITTPEGKIIKANKFLMEMMGYDSYEEFMQINLEDEVHLRHGYSRKTFRELLEKDGEIKGLENLWRKRGGEVICIRENARVITDADGSVYYQGTVEDITERKNIERTLLESESRYRALASNFPNGAVVLFDHDFRYLLAEGKEISEAGFKKEALEGKTMEEVFSERVCKVLLPHFTAALNGESGMFELDGIKGECYLVYTVPLKDDSSHAGAAGMAMFQNITHMKNIERELKELNADKDKFFSIISHDLKSPFSSLLGFSEFLASDFDQLSPEEVKTFAQNIHKSAKSVFDLLENLLQWSRLQTGGMEYSPVRFNLRDLAEEIYSIYEISAIKKRITLSTEIDDKIEVFADKNMIEAVLRNLVSNAIKFTQPGGEVSIRAKSENVRVVVSVADNGVGISTENQKKLFAIGEKLTTLGTEKERGTGLGLILSKEFVEKNNGTLELKSQPGEGSEFSFTLPEFKREIVLRF